MNTGYIGFAKLLERSSIPLDREVFGFIFELGTCGDQEEIEQEQKQSESWRPTNVDVETIISRELVPVLSRILRAEALFAKPPKCSRKFVVVPFESTTHDDDSSSTGSASRQSMDVGGKSVTGVRNETTLHLRTPSWSSLSLADMGVVGGSKESEAKASVFSSSPSSSPSSSSSSATSSSSLQANSTGTTGARSVGPERTLMQRQTSQQRTESLFGLQTMRRFRSTEAALMAIVLLPHATPAVQIAVIRSFGALLDANPANCRALCDMNVPFFLLRIVTKLHEDTRGMYLQLVAQLLRYDIAPEEALLLFKLSNLNLSNFTDVEPGVIKEIQMQILYVIGQVVERVAPRSYFNFDGTDGALCTGPVRRFPASTIGYTVECWMRLNNFRNESLSFMTWEWRSAAGSAGHGKRLELLFVPAITSDRGVNGAEVQRRHAKVGLVLRLWEDGVEGVTPTMVSEAAFPSYLWSSVGTWHHLAVTHHETELALFVDGVPRGRIKARKEMYPDPFATTTSSGWGVASDVELKCSVGKSDLQDHRKQSDSRNFCGQLGTINIVQGLWRATEIATLFQQGTDFEDHFRTLGLPGKRIFTLHPATYVPDEEARSARTLGVLDADVDGVLGKGGVTRNSSPKKELARAHPSIPLKVVCSLSPESSSLRSRSPTLSLMEPMQLPLRVRKGTIDDSDRESNGSTISSSTTSSLAAAPKRISITPKFVQHSSPKKGGGFVASVGGVGGGLGLGGGTVGLAGVGGAAGGAESSADSQLGFATVHLSPSKKAPVASMEVSVQGYVDIHHTRTIKDGVSVSKLNGVGMCFCTIALGSAEQIAGLRILSGLLHNCMATFKTFEDSGGFAVLGHALSLSLRKDVS